MNTKHFEALQHEFFLFLQKKLNGFAKSFLNIGETARINHKGNQFIVLITFKKEPTQRRRDLIDRLMCDKILPLVVNKSGFRLVSFECHFVYTSKEFLPLKSWQGMIKK